MDQQLCGKRRLNYEPEDQPPHKIYIIEDYNPYRPPAEKRYRSDEINEEYYQNQKRRRTKI